MNSFFVEVEVRCSPASPTAGVRCPHERIRADSSCMNLNARLRLQFPKTTSTTGTELRMNVRYALLCITVFSLTGSSIAFAHPAIGHSGVHVSIIGDKWQIDGRVTDPGTLAEGLLLNVRMVNCTFEDANSATRPSDFNTDANTQSFIAQIPDYVDHGVRAFTLNLQGGMPGYEGAINTAFASDGTIRPEYLARVGRVIEACRQHGAIVILGCFYQRQDQRLRDADAVRAAVANTASWVKGRGFENVVLEIANEFGHSGYDHELLRSAAGQVELMRVARKAAPGCLSPLVRRGTRYQTKLQTRPTSSWCILTIRR